MIIAGQRVAEIGGDAAIARQILEFSRRRETEADRERRRSLAELPGDELERLIRTLEAEMADASQELRFEYAARLRDEIKDLRRELSQVQ